MAGMEKGGTPDAIRAAPVDAWPMPAVAAHPLLRPPVRTALTVVVNGRASGVDRPDETLDRVVALLREHGAAARGMVTHDLAGLRDATRAALGGRLVLVGGDGGVHAFANLGPQLPEVALIPMGQANNVARALGVPADVAGAALLAATGAARPVDALRVETPARRLVAVEGVSAGFHAAARHRYTAENSGALVAGAGAFGRELAAFSPYEAEVVVDGMPLSSGDLAQVFVSNLPYFAYGFHVDPMARVDDGLIEAIVLRARSRAGVVRLVSAAKGGGHLGRRGVSWSHGSTVALPDPLPVVADAEPLGVTSARVSVLPSWMRVVAPTEVGG
jgi:diacylglycerol kinase (ATP)